MKIEILSDVDKVAREGARIIAEEARVAVTASGQFVFAVSGGQTPWLMLHALTKEDVPWEGVHLVQVDERVAPAGSADRNLTNLRKTLLNNVPLCSEQIHAMPVTAADLEAGARRYARVLEQIAGSPAVLDLVHLGLGPDGHTASLIPGDPVLEIKGRDVAPTGVYQGKRRMTLTFPILNRARRILWVITGSEKHEMFRRLRSGDASIPAGRVRQDHALALVDRAAAEGRR